MKNLSKWTTCTVGDVTRTFSGGTPSRSRPDYFGGAIPWIKSGELNSGWVTGTSECLTDAGLKASAARLVKPETTLLALYGATAGVLGRTRISAAINQEILAIEPDESRLEPDYLQYLLKSITAALLRGVQGAQPNLNAGMVPDSKVELPPIREQRKIADILTTWDEALEKLDTLIAAKDRRKKALMQRQLSGSLRIPSNMQGDWQMVPMGSLLKRVFRPIDWSPDMPLSLVSLRRRCGGLFRRPVVLGADYKTKDLHELKADDFLVSKRQVVHGAWGRVTDEFAGTQVSKEYAIFVNKAPAKLHMPYFGWLAQTPRMIYLARVACTDVHLEKMIFDPAVFLRETISIPSDVREQKAIADLLDTCDAELTLLRRQRDALDLQKRGLMQRLLTGKIRISLAP